MIGDLAAISEAVAISAPPSSHRPIAVVGAGAIMTVAHLPAYKAAGLPVVGVLDVDRDRAAAAADRFDIPRVYSSLDALLADEEVEVVDVAIPAALQPDVVRVLVDSGRHVLAQKPFAPSVEVATELVELAEARGTVLAVNQQLRFDEGIAAAKAALDLGWLGEVTALSIDVDIWTEWSDWAWLLGVDRLEIMNHSIHYHDAVRWLLGDPAVVFCAAGRRPGQAARGETRTVATYLYDSGVRAVVSAHHMNDHGDPRAEFRVEGTHGALRGTLGLLYDYPHGRPDTLEIHSRVLPTDGWLPYPVTSRWIPDAFLGPMASVLAAVAEGEPLRSSARDNLGTLRLCDALYESIETREAVHL